MSPVWQLIDDPFASADVAEQWDELWARSTSRSATAQAEQLALWCDSFAPDPTLRLIVVRDDELADGRWLAALPVLRQRWRGLLPVGALPGNEWSLAGDLLVDETVLGCDDANRIADTLAAGLSRLNLPLYRFHGVAAESPAWRLLRAALSRQGWTADVRPMHDVPILRRFSDWAACRASWSKEHRHNLERLRRRLDEGGGAALVRHRLHEMPADGARALMLRAFDVERSSWKGDAGSAIANDESRTTFFVAQSRMLARRGAAELVCLERDATILAFAYGWTHRGVTQVAKIGYDPEFARFGPGQLLFHDWLRELHDDTSWRALDFLGPATPALRRWTGDTYSVERLLLAPSRWLSRTLLRTLRPGLATSPAVR